MKVAVIGSRGIVINGLEKYLPSETTEIVSGGAKGIDSCAENFAKNNGLTIKVFLPQYEKYGRSAPLKRNMAIIDYSDTVLAFWDGESKGTKYVVDKCKEKGKEVKVIIIKK